MSEAEISAAAKRIIEALTADQGGSMQPPRKPPRTLRSDAGSVHFNDADLAGLCVIGEMYAVRVDVMARFLGRSVGATRQWATRMRSARMLKFGQILAAQTTYLWLTPLGYRAALLPYEGWEPNPGRLRHIHQVCRVRLFYSRWRPKGTWVSERQVRRDVAGGSRARLPHLPDALFLPGGGTRIAIEVELTAKTIDRVVFNLLEMPEEGRWCDQVHYIVSPAAQAVVLAAVKRAQADPRGKGVTYRVFSLGSLDDDRLTLLNPDPE